MEPPMKKLATSYSILMAASQRTSLPDTQTAPAARVAPAFTAGQMATYTSQRQQPVAATSSFSAATPSNTAPTRSDTVTQPSVHRDVAVVASTLVRGRAPVAQLSGQLSVPRPSGFSQPQAARRPAVPPAVIPSVTMPVGQHRRLSDAGFGNASSSHKTFTAAQQEPVETAAGANGQTPRSPAARKAGSSPSAGARSSRSPVSSPPRQPRSPARAVVSGGGFGPGTFGAPDGSSGGGDIADVLASYLDDFRHEVRDMVHGMQVDMVRQSVAAEMLYQKDIAVLQQSNRVLREEIGRLRQELAANMPFEPL